MNKETKTRSEELKTATAKTTKLDQKAWEKLNKITDEPPEPTEALKALMKNS